MPGLRCSFFLSDEDVTPAVPSQISRRRTPPALVLDSVPAVVGPVANAIYK